MLPDYPQLRSDLVVSRQETRAGIQFVVKDPATARFFRLREAEHFILEQLDGETPPEAVRLEVERRFGASLSPETFRQFLETLRRNRLLEEENVLPGAPPRRSRLVRGSLLYLRLAAFDPDRLLTRMARALSFVFTRSFVLLSALTIAAAAYIAVGNWTDIHRGLGQLYRFDALLLAGSILYAISAAHEFAHGLTCKHFGGEVHEMGFLLLYFQPAFYCNVSEAWLLPRRYQRLWVSFAGAYFELFVCAVATVVWRVVEPGTALSPLALIVMVTSAIKTFLISIP